MTRASRLLWYLLVVTPLLSLVAGISASVTARSADESLGQIFIAMPFAFATLILALIVLVATLSSRGISSGERAASLLLCAAFLPMIALVMVTAGELGWPRNDSWALRAGGLALLHGGWLALMVRLRRKLRRSRAQLSAEISIPTTQDRLQ